MSSNDYAGWSSPDAPRQPAFAAAAAAADKQQPPTTTDEAFPFDRRPTAPQSPSDGASAYPSPLHTADDLDNLSSASSHTTTTLTVGNGLNPLLQPPTSDERDQAPPPAKVADNMDEWAPASGVNGTGEAGSGVGTKVTSLEQEENAGGPPMPAAGVEAAARKLPLGVDADQVMEDVEREEEKKENGVSVDQWVNGELDGPEEGQAGLNGGYDHGMPGNEHELKGEGSPPITEQESESDRPFDPSHTGGEAPQRPPMSMDVDQPLSPSANGALPTPTSMSASQSPVLASAPHQSQSLAPLSTISPSATIQPQQSLLSASPKAFVSPPSLKRPSPGAEIDTVVLQPGAVPQSVHTEGGVGVSFQTSYGEGEPPAKRARVDDEGGSTASPAPVPPPPHPVAASTPPPHSPSSHQLPSAPLQSQTPFHPSRQASLAPHLRGRLSAARHRFCLSSIRNLKKHREAGPFVQPVDIVLLKIPDYPKIVTKPMDLGTVEKRLMLQKSDAKGNLITVVPPPAGSEHLRPYEWVEEWINDVQQIWANCYAFNGSYETAAISKMARVLEEVFDKQLAKMPPFAAPVPATGPAQSPSESSASKKKGSTPTSATARRPSVSASAQRLDRPKRDVQPPAKIQAFTDAAPLGKRRKSNARAPLQSKKAVEEIKFAERLIKELHKKQHEGFTWPFLHPVDYVSLGIPDYPKIIKKPMDLGTVRNKLDNAVYRNGAQFEYDVRLIFSNCYQFNPPSNPVCDMARKLEAFFDEKWEERPRTRDVSPEEDEDEDEDDEDEDDPKAAQIALLQKQLASLHQTLDSLQNADVKPPKKKKRKSDAGEAAHAPPPKPKAPKAPKVPASGAGPSNVGSSAAKPPRTSPVQPKKASSKPKKPKKDLDEVTFEMKSELAEKIPTFDGPKLEKAVDIIKKGMPQLISGEDDKEIELDIDLLDQKTLLKLYEFVVGKPQKKGQEVKKSAIQLGPKKPQRAATGGVARKQIDEEAQAAQIAALESQLAAFDSAPGGGAGGAVGQQQVGMAAGAGDLASSSSESEDGSDSESESEEE